VSDGMQKDESAEKSGKTAEDRLKALENESDIAADYLEELMDIDGDRAAVSIVGADLSNLVGENGKVLEALQELTRLAVYRETGERSRLMLDVSNYRANRKAELEQVGRKAVEEAKATGAPVRLDPMTPFERKVVHDVVAAAGLTSESEGEEPRRRVVVQPS
jgi:spoIIIJ-associated protein